MEEVNQPKPRENVNVCAEIYSNIGTHMFASELGVKGACQHHLLELGDKGACQHRLPELEVKGACQHRLPELGVKGACQHRLPELGIEGACQQTKLFFVVPVHHSQIRSHTDTSCITLHEAGNSQMLAIQTEGSGQLTKIMVDQWHNHVCTEKKRIRTQLADPQVVSLSGKRYVIKI